MIGRNRWIFGLLMALVIQGAWAEGGRINFTGAVLEPTCAIDTSQMTSAAFNQAPTHRTCGQSAADAGRSYSRTVNTLDTAAAANDRLLGYFSSYAPVGADGKPVTGVIVRTYD